MYLTRYKIFDLSSKILNFKIYSQFIKVSFL